jgi:hypothetical protein
MIMKLFLPEVKLDKIILACKQLLAKPNSTAREVARVTGLLVSALPAINYLKLYYRSLEIYKSRVLSQCEQPDYEQVVTLSVQAQSGLYWVIHCYHQLRAIPTNDWANNNSK